MNTEWAVEKKKLEKVVNYLRKEVKQILHTHNKVSREDPAPPGPEDIFLNKMYQKMLNFMPIFIIHATKHMLDPDMIKDYPNVRDRYKYISDKFVMAGEHRGGIFSLDFIVEYSVMKLLLKHIENTETN